MTEHEQVAVEHGGFAADVDEGLATLILALWQRGYRTVASCEAQEGTRLDADGRPAAWIAFATEDAAESFQRVMGPEAQILTFTEEQVAADANYRPGVAAVVFPSTRIQDALQAVIDSETPA